MPITPDDRKTILIVDDEQLVRDLISGVFAHNDIYNVLVAETGEQGLRKSKEFKGEIHLLLTDFQMAGMSGIELATAMTVDRPNLKVLMMSSFPEGMLLLNDGWHYVPKPFIPSQLRCLVAGLVSPDSKSRFAAAEPLN
jgi:DNA-binding NtrC family response regulator